MGTMKESYEAYQNIRQALSDDGFATLWAEQERRYVPPFNLFGNIWYVGDSWVCVHLIDTGEGLLLIDSGNCGATAMLIQSIWEIGFDPRNVRWIIHSHGHLDHIGGAMFFKRMFGTELLLGEPDAKMFMQQPELSLIQDSRNIWDELFVPDRVIHEGDILTFGNTMINCRLVPGHTEGCIALFFDAYNGNEVRRCGYYGGFGFNTLTAEYLREIGDVEYKMRQTYLDSLKKVRNERVEIFLGNHCVNNQTLERRQKQIENPSGPNPFVDEQIWGIYLDQMRDELLTMMTPSTIE